MLSLLAGMPQAPNPETIKIANSYEQRGIMSKQEYIRINNIATKIAKGGKVTDSDLDFALALAKSNALDSKETPFRHEQTVAYSVFDYKKWTPSQKDKLLQTAIWLMHQPKPTHYVFTPQANKNAAIFLLGAVNDKRAIPYLGFRESDPDPEVDKLAKAVCDRVTKAVSHSKASKHTSSSSK
jgi:hypothetical protein